MPSDCPIPACPLTGTHRAENDEMDCPHATDIGSCAACAHGLSAAPATEAGRAEGQPETDDAAAKQASQLADIIRGLGGSEYTARSLEEGFKQAIRDAVADERERCFRIVERERLRNLDRPSIGGLLHWIEGEISGEGTPLNEGWNEVARIADPQEGRDA